MRLRTALTEHERRRGERYPAERPTTAGAFTGDDGRLVHVGPDGSVHDCSYSLSGVGGADRLRMGITAGRGVRWFDELTTTRQHYDDDTPLVETEYDAGRYTIHQYDLVVGDTHLTHVELRGAPPADAELVAACAFSPDMVEGRVGNLVHKEAGPDDGSVVEVYHRTEHDFLTASTGLSAAHGQRLRTITELLGEDENGFPHRGEIDQREDSRLTPDVVVRAPFERDGRTERVTLASRAVVDRRETRETGDDAMDALSDGPDRRRRIEEISRIATAYPDASDLREAAAGRGPTVPEDIPRRGVIASDLRALDLLTAESGARIAAPEFDPFYSTSGGYGYTWFRDEAETATALLNASEELDLDADEELLATASFFCRTQDADGSWPHRVWADSGKVAPGWANARIEGENGSAGPNDQLDQPAAVVAFLARLRRTTDLPEEWRERIDATIADAVAFLRETTEADGLPRRCQNCWENALGRFTHTGASYLRAFAAVARAPVDDETRVAAAAAADDALAGLDERWNPDTERFPQRASEESRDERADASTFALASAVVEYAALRDEREGVDGAVTDGSGATVAATDFEAFLDHVRTHVLNSIEALRRETADVEGLVRFIGDDWRTAEQGAAKVWSISTLWGATAAASLAGLVRERDGDATRLFDAARQLYALCEPDGPFVNDAGLFAEQVFDDGDLDSATPIGWSHALRIDATVTLAKYGALPVPHDTPTGPDEAPHWTTGRKFGVGTPADHQSEDPVPVWFTLTEGALTEARFPRIDVMNVRTFDFLVADPETGHTVRTFDETSHVSTTETVERTTEPTADDALAYTQTIRETGDGHGHEWTLTVEYAVDTDGDAILADVEFEGGREYDVYALVDTTVTNVGTDDRGERVADADGYHLTARNDDAADGHTGKLVDDDGDSFEVALALASESRFEWASTLLAGGHEAEGLFSDGERGPGLTEANGNIMLAGLVGSGTAVSETLALGFAEEADADSALAEAKSALSRGYVDVADSYVETWRTWLADREFPASVTGDADLETQYRFALMTLAAVEDKRHDGAGIASPSVPWGETEYAAEDRGYGYNFVWSRDLYQVFTALIEVGEVERGADALAYLYNTQQDDDGFLPQNTYIDGRTRWGGEQMDNIAFPSVMAWQLYEHGVSPADADYTYDQVRRSLGYIAANGPETAQERWEEEAGFSPSSIAAEIAGLVCGAALAVAEADRIEAGDASAEESPGSLRADALAWLALADDWTARVEEWCATSTGTERHSETPYYVRVTADGDPESGRPRTIANDGPTYDEREIVDGGFLELVRLGVKPADDDAVRNSVSVVDDSIRVDTPYGPGWYRYVGDAYGEIARGDPGGPWAGTGDGRGRLWPIFTGERGEYELRARADGPDGFGGTDEDALEPDALLETMAGFGNSGRMLPEQVWDREHPTDYGWEFGEGTGGATPLAWSMAGFIRLAHGVEAGEPVETPTVVRDRYVERDRSDAPDLTALDTLVDGDVVVAGKTTADVVAIYTPNGAALATPKDGEYEFTLDSELDARTVVVAAANLDADRDVTDADAVLGDFAGAGTAVERIRL
ncbi:glycoside hydrolase family 15 protein [Halorubrum kocurii]|uniref:Glycoside hydrolase 15-related protein n=1 Tax=Halorubrum kocurii JCM 14978 TaxID=1230456 RepID=M0NME8_9EURY|nr:glycoside hydrolase family 15 protein [Halorubrum kocurii]EMA58334.1 glycoside hydrolase 15-related protein [Halorubrum kocurii JCM 14978]